MSRDAATEAQVRAARPGVSSWVSANAGSGKTRVLTDRVARLLLQGTDPRRILCLTYTKAAAAEMQNRLFARLGDWAMRPDAELRAALAALDEDAAGIADADLAMARRLFAGALETPGGLKIQTIHSFCDALLRRFPVEAGVSPQFTVMEDRQAAQLRQTLAEKLAERPSGGFGDLVPHILSLEGGFDGLLQAILAHRDRFSLDPEGEALPRAFNATAPEPDMAEALPPAALARLISMIERYAGLSEKGLLPLLQALSTGDPAASETLYETALKQDRSPRSIKAGKPLQKALPDAQEHIDAVIGWCVAVEERHRLSRTVESARALIRFGRTFIDAYDTAKRDLGALDFDDLIRLAKDLLSHAQARDWVAYKLDGGIDHVLVDEAQDTSPAQWEVIDATVAEFFAGESARNVTRTLFVVGDEKQSIYSFQGAEPAAFGAQEARYRGLLEDIRQTLERCELQFSFRSAPPILEVVDAVCALRDPTAAGGTTHRAFHDTRPGRVELWPFLPAEPKPPQPDPWLPAVVPKPPDPQVVLAEKVAQRVAEMLRDAEPLPGAGRPVAPGDVLILVRRRAVLFRAVIRALKANRVPVAGADRLKVMEEIAPRDLVAFLTAIATPEDDLSLAAALKSPIFGLSEAALYRLAVEREGTLAEALLAADGAQAEAAELYRDVRDKADFLRPYELIDRILTRHGARQRFAARLGPEAEDAIAALQDLALDYEQVEAPTLTGFLDWLASGDAERKRQLETGGSEVRVMTVHGAKGLEAPVVILPDTLGGENGGNAGPLRKVGELAVALAGRAETRPQALAKAEETRVRLEQEEYARLLYVAMTRAERWLIVCGAGTSDPKPDSWYGVVAQAMESVGAAEAEDGTLVHARHGMQDAPSDASAGEPVVLEAPDQLPDWLFTAPPAPVAGPPALSPSGAAEVTDSAGQAGGGGNGAEPEAARQRGIWLHALLEVLPDHPPQTWDALGPQLLAAEELPPATGEVAALMAEATDLLRDPALRWIFGPGSLPEQDITGQVLALNGRVIRGRIDRLVVDGPTVWAIDYKSDTASPENIPPAYATQLALYVAALREVFPDHEVKAAILWTRARRLVQLDQDAVTAALETFAAH